MEGVEGVVGECLHVLQVGSVAGGAGGFESGEDVVAGVVEDPISVLREWRVSMAESDCNCVGWETYRILSTPAHLSSACRRASCKRSPS